jgi:hypothetical protein
MACSVHAGKKVSEILQMRTGSTPDGSIQVFPQNGKNFECEGRFGLRKNATGRYYQRSAKQAPDLWKTISDFE